MIKRKNYTFIFEGTKYKIFFVDKSHKVYHCHKYKDDNKYRYSFWYDENGNPEKLIMLKILHPGFTIWCVVLVYKYMKKLFPPFYILYNSIYRLVLHKAERRKR